MTDADMNTGVDAKLAAKITVDNCPMFDGIKLKVNAMPGEEKKQYSSVPSGPAANLFNSKGEALVYLTVVTSNDVPLGIEHSFQVSWKKYAEAIASLERDGKPDTGAHSILVGINPWIAYFIVDKARQSPSTPEKYRKMSMVEPKIDESTDEESHAQRGTYVGVRNGAEVKLLETYFPTECYWGPTSLMVTASITKRDGPTQIIAKLKLQKFVAEHVVPDLQGAAGRVKWVKMTLAEAPTLVESLTAYNGLSQTEAEEYVELSEMTNNPAMDVQMRRAALQKMTSLAKSGSMPLKPKDVAQYLIRKKQQYSDLADRVNKKRRAPDATDPVSEEPNDSAA